MDVKKWMMASLAGFIVMFTISGLWYQIIMSDFYSTLNADIMRDQVNVVFIVLGYLFLALMMSYMYPLGYKGGPPVKEGLRFGVMVGLLVWFSANLILHGAWNLSLTGGIVDSVYHLLEQGLGGLVIALVYRNKSNESDG